MPMWPSIALRTTVVTHLKELKVAIQNQTLSILVTLKQKKKNTAKFKNCNVHLKD